MRTATKQLAAHPLAKKVLDNLRPLLDATSRDLDNLAQKGQVRSTEDHQLLEHQWYDNDLFNHISALSSGIENLEQSRNFIQVFPQPRRHEKKGVSQHVWIEYHYSHYLITLVSLFDISLILTNSVFRLGNRERDCKTDFIIKNSWVAQTPVASALNKLDELIKPHRTGRNLHVHRGKIPKIASVMDSETLDKLALFSFVQMCGKPVVDRQRLELAYKGQVQQICSRLLLETGRIRDSVWEISDALMPIYDKKAAALRTKWREILEKELARRKKPTS